MSINIDEFLDIIQFFENLSILKSRKNSEITLNTQYATITIINLATYNHLKAFL